MKKLILLFSFCLLVFAGNAQQAFYNTANDTVNGDTTSVSYLSDVKYNGFVTWDFTAITNASDDTVYVEFQGSNITDLWIPLDTATITGAAAITTQFIDNPATYLNYRLYERANEATDTAFFSNKVFIYKR